MFKEFNRLKRLNKRSLLDYVARNNEAKLKRSIEFLYLFFFHNKIIQTLIEKWRKIEIKKKHGSLQYEFIH